MELKVDTAEEQVGPPRARCFWAAQIASAYGLRDSRRPKTNLRGT